VTLASNKASVIVTLTPLPDAVDETTETAILTLSTGSGYTVNAGGTSAGLTITDQTYGKPVVTAVATDAVAAEPGLKANKGAIRITRTESCDKALTVPVVVGGTALNGVDYVKVTVPVTLAVGQSSKVLTIAPLADAVVDSNETVTVTIQADAAFQIGTGQGVATVTIADTTDLTKPTVAVVATDPIAAEPGALVNPGRLTFSRTSRFHELLVINYAIGGTASNGVDYDTLSGSATLLPGKATTTLRIIPKADALPEGTETMILTLKPAAAFTIDGAKGAATVTIGE